MATASTTPTTPTTEPGERFGALWSARRPRLYLDDDAHNAAHVLSRLPVDFCDIPEQADLLWVRTDPRAWDEAIESEQALNHIPGQSAITRKADLARNLHRYGRLHADAPFSHADFMQPTFCLADRDELDAFVAALPERDHRDNLWILKPSGLSRGRGVKIVWRFDWLRRELRKHGCVTVRYEGEARDYVIQRYIKDVLLLDGRKSELRVYWLVASLDPLLVLMYPAGTARLTSQPYRLDDFSNPLVHITNVYQQKKHAGYDPDAVLKWDFAALQAYLTREKSAPEDFVQGKLAARLRQILAYVVRAGAHELRKTSREAFYFGLYGADFILDDRLTPWLTEIQGGPGLSFDDMVKQHVVPPMLEGAVAIALELLARKRQGLPLAELSCTHGYEWVIRGD